MKLSPENARKISGYIGFALKAGKVTIGVDNILLTDKRMLVIVDAGLKENSRKKLNAHVAANGLNIITVDCLSDLFPLEGVKAIGIREKNLAEAIQKITEQII